MTMVYDYRIRVTPEVAASEQRIREYIGRVHGVHAAGIRIVKRSIDARQRDVWVNLQVKVYAGEVPQEEPDVPACYPCVEGKPAVVVVGAGPGGLFAALRLVELGLKPVVVERGQDVRRRKRDLAEMVRGGMVNPDSNFCFGEGGAGAYSDGKLYTRSRKRGDVDRILRVLCWHGAPPDIRVDAHPHIGTDKLPRIIASMRNTIMEHGGEVHFGTCMEALLTDNGRVRGIRVRDGRVFEGPVILATGHSARDVYRWLYANGVEMEPKGLAIGVRLEHPAGLIDRIQYHSPHGRGRWLPAAEYSFVTQVEGRGVYSFCMCPGGFVVPAASGLQQVVVNGMSPANRGSRWSNSGMVVEVRPEDLGDRHLIVGGGLWGDVLGMMRLQERLERLCWQQGGGGLTAPAQRMADFVNHRLGADLPPSSYVPGLVASPLHDWLPPFIGRRLEEGFRCFGRNARGFLTNEAVLIGIETRTSAPVRVPRDGDTLQHIRLKGLFPCGEGAGYAGGIVSAAIDGERCAEKVKEYGIF